ncbi:MAG: hypothetical protein MRK01_01155 [Candidatus Scalindua sp.]|nr:hypothetical protein [Candidatus Scalindua sp.]
MKSPSPKKLFIEKCVVDLPITRQIVDKLPEVPIEYIDDYRNIDIIGDTVNGIFRESKECLAIAEKRGRMVKQFRCRDGIRGCTEYNIIHGNNCSFDCEYCFLQSYLGNAVPTVFVNHDEMLREIRDVILASGNKKTLFHAGELCDALGFDDLTGLSRRLVLLFSEFSQARLELRTKTTIIENLLDVSIKKKIGTANVVVSWTFTPQASIDLYEHKTPSIEERIDAAAKVQEAGYFIGLCLDPIIRCDGWFKKYDIMITRLFSRLDHKRIKFVSLGGFRFLPSLSNVIRERNPDTDILLGEFVPCVDGKYRYFRPLRVEIYRKLWNLIRQKLNDDKISLCMESHEVWREVGAGENTRFRLPDLTDSA